jgi:methionyl-tRNA formyltransferase
VVTEPIGACDTTGDLLARLAVTGAELLVATMDGIESGELAARPQPADGVSLAPKITPEDAHVNWALPAGAVSRLIRACTPAPGAWTVLAGTRVKLGPLAGLAAAPDAGAGAGASPGSGAGPGPAEMRVERSRVIVGTGTVPVELGDVQPHGKRPMQAADWARGLHLAGRSAVLR